MTTAVPPHRVLAAFAVMLLLAASAAGCKFKGPVAAGACDWMSGHASGGRTAFLLDVSASTRSRHAGSAPDYAYALQDAIAEAVDRLDTVSVAAFGGSVNDLVWTTRDVSADYKAGNDNADNQKDRKKQGIECLTTSVTQALAAAPPAAGTDVLGAMRRAIPWLAAGPGAEHLVVATDGLVTTGCADLTKSSFAVEREIATISGLCAQRREVEPAAQSAVHVTMIGVGHPASDQPVPTPQQARWLTTLWRSLCGRSCSLIDVPATAAGNDERAAGEHQSQDPVVGFQRGRQVYALPSLVLFDTDSSTLKPEAIPMLQDIAVSIRTTAFASVDVDGYADPRGDDAHNRTLSQQRAESVARALGSGIGAHPHGRGATRNCPYAMAASEPGNGDNLPCARRVEIVVTTKDSR
jgi:outer membrane protein OmpA-like peptidoglycan-associated protein